MCEQFWTSFTGILNFVGEMFYLDGPIFYGYNSEQQVWTFTVQQFHLFTHVFANIHEHFIALVWTWLNEFVAEIGSYLRGTHIIVRYWLHIASDQMKAHYDIRVRSPGFSIRDHIWLNNPACKKGHWPKLQQDKDGPYVILILHLIFCRTTLLLRSLRIVFNSSKNTFRLCYSFLIN